MIYFWKLTTLISVMCSFGASTELPKGVDRYAYCESCLATSKEMDTIERKVSFGSRTQLVDKLVDDVLCESASFQRHSDIPVDQLRTACKHLLDVHGEEFRDALLHKESTRKDILLCYESSLACVGVKRHNSKESSFTDKDIEELLQKNNAELRIALPIHTNITKMTSKDEL